MQAELNVEEIVRDRSLKVIWKGYTCSLLFHIVIRKWNTMFVTQVN